MGLESYVIDAGYSSHMLALVVVSMRACHLMYCQEASSCNLPAVSQPTMLCRPDPQACRLQALLPWRPAMWVQSAAGSGSNNPLEDLLCRAAFLAAPLLHAAALFSNSFILAEGRALGFGLATLTVVLTRSAVLTASQQQQKQQGVGADGCVATVRDAAPANIVKTAPTAALQIFETQANGLCQRSALADGIPSTQTDASPLAAEGVPSCLAASNDMPISATTNAEGVPGSLSVPAVAAQQPAAAPAVGAQSSVGIVATGAAALMLLWALGQRGLVVRSGHDAMWRTAAEHRTLLPAAGTVSMRH